MKKSHQPPDAVLWTPEFLEAIVAPEILGRSLAYALFEHSIDPHGIGEIVTGGKALQSGQDGELVVTVGQAFDEERQNGRARGGCDA